MWGHEIAQQELSQAGSERPNEIRFGLPYQVGDVLAQTTCALTTSAQAAGLILQQTCQCHDAKAIQPSEVPSSRASSIYQ